MEPVMHRIYFEDGHVNYELVNNNQVMMVLDLLSFMNNTS